MRVNCTFVEQKNYSHNQIGHACLKEDIPTQWKMRKVSEMLSLIYNDYRAIDAWSNNGKTCTKWFLLRSLFKVWGKKRSVEEIITKTHLLNKNINKFVALPVLPKVYSIAAMLDDIPFLLYHFRS